MPFTKAHARRILNVKGEPFIDPERLPHLGMRLTETYLRRKLYALEDRTVTEQWRTFDAAHADIRTYGLRVADSVRLDTLTRDYASIHWQQQVMTYARQRLQTATALTSQAAFKASLTAWYANYYGKAWQLDVNTRPDVRVNVPTPSQWEAHRGVLLPDVREAVQPSDALYTQMGDEWRQRYLDELAEMLVKVRRGLERSTSEGHTVTQSLRRMRDSIGLADTMQTGFTANFYRMQSLTRTAMMDGAEDGAEALWLANSNPEKERKGSRVDDMIGTILLSQVRWITANDERVCFPAFTSVLTQQGNRPIQSVRVGDKVKTRAGWQTVIAASKRPYTGAMVCVVTERGRVISTADHPYWTLEQGWLQGVDLNISHTLQSVDNQPVKVLRVINFDLRKSNNFPSVLMQIFVFLCITLGVSMPVFSIHLKRYTQIAKQKVNAVASHLGLLDVLNIKSLKSLTNTFFKQRFAVELPITGKTAKLSCCTAGLNSKLNTTIPALNEHRRATAFFRAIMSIQSLFSAKDFATPFTSNIFGFMRPAFSTANSVTISSRTANPERLTANGTNFLNCFMSKFTFFRAVASILPDSRWGMTDNLTAIGARYRNLLILKLGVALSRAKGILVWIAGFAKDRFATLSAFSLNHSASQTVTNVVILYHILSGKQPQVYDIQVENQPEFFANGVLVHNCVICRGFDGQISSLFDWGRNRPPAHGNCRCNEIPVIIEALMIDPDRFPDQTFDEWLSGVGGGLILDDFMTAGLTSTQV